MSDNLPPLTGDPSKDLPALTGDPRKDLAASVGSARVIRAPERSMQADIPEVPSDLAMGALRDMLALSGRPGSEPLGRAVYDPKGWGERLILPAITAPLARGAGAGA